MKADKQSTADISFSKHAYNLIKEKIIRDELKQNTLVSVLSLANELKVGRMPVTMACKQLECEGFIKVIPKQGVLINPTTIDDVRELYESRLAIEIFMAGKAFNSISEKDVQVLDKSIEKQKFCYGKADPYAFMEEDTFFHRFILAKYSNDTLMRMHHNLTDRILFFGIRNSRNREKVKKDIMTHEAIVAALKSHDINEFLKQIEFNIMSGYLLMTSMFSTLKPGVD